MKTAWRLDVNTIVLVLTLHYGPFLEWKGFAFNTDQPYGIHTIPDRLRTDISLTHAIINKTTGNQIITAMYGNYAGYFLQCSVTAIQVNPLC
jgi:hypothetical protein